MYLFILKDPRLSDMQEERRYFWNWDGIQGEDFIFITHNLLMLTLKEFWMRLLSLQLKF